MALDRYITNYITKAEKNATKKLWDDCNRSKSLRSKLKSFALKNLKARECGIYEVCDKLLGFPMYRFSSKVTFLSTMPKNLRKRMLKNKRLIEKLPANSTNIFHDNFLDSYYPNRPNELEHMSLFKFVSWYEIKPKKCELPSHTDCYPLLNNRGFIHKRTEERILKIFDIKLNYPKDFENYFYQQLILFRPWRDEDELMEPYDTYEHTFEHFKNSNCPVSDKGINFDYDSFNKLDIQFKRSDLAIKKVKEFNDANLPKIENEPINNSVNNPKLTEARLGVLDFVYNETDVNALSKSILSLNIRQKRIFDKVIQHISSNDGLKNCKTNSSICPKNKPLRLFVSGVAGKFKIS